MVPWAHTWVPASSPLTTTVYRISLTVLSYCACQLSWHARTHTQTNSHDSNSAWALKVRRYLCMTMTVSYHISSCCSKCSDATRSLHIRQSVRRLDTSLTLIGLIKLKQCRNRDWMQRHNRTESHPSIHMADIVTINILILNVTELYYHILVGQTIH